MDDRQESRARRGLRDLSGRAVAAIVLAVLVVVFIVLNRRQTRISFIVFTTQTALWVALAVAALGGFVAGFLISRRRYRA